MRILKEDINIKPGLLCLSILVISFSCKNGIDKTSEMAYANQKSIVVLTYDDALNVHLDNVLPLLDSLNINATFYLNTAAESVSARRSEWKKVARTGHELGNHTIHHPCIGASLGREWVHPEKDLDHYTVSKILEEIEIANDTLNNIDGLERRTFAYTCGDTTANHQSYVSGLRKLFPSARGVNRGNNDLDSIDNYHINAFSIEGHQFKDLKLVIEENHKNEGLLVFLLHGVGGGHSLNMDSKEHAKLLRYLNEMRDSIWITTMIKATTYLENR